MGTGSACDTTEGDADAVRSCSSRLGPPTTCGDFEDALFDELNGNVDGNGGC